MLDGDGVYGAFFRFEFQAENILESSEKTWACGAWRGHRRRHARVMANSPSRDCGTGYPSPANRFGMTSKDKNRQTGNEKTHT
jgi:hypothetical protein